MTGADYPGLSARRSVQVRMRLRLTPMSLLPMGLFLNPADLNVTLDGKAALHSNIQVIPPSGR